MIHRLARPPASPPPSTVAVPAAPQGLAATDPLPLDRAALSAFKDSGAQVDLRFFWGHRPSPDGRITSSCLSQWWEQPFSADGVTYATAEHYMMAAKARLFGDGETAARIVQCRSPREAKALGRAVTGFVEARWSAARTGIVIEGNLAKFSQHRELADFLAFTGTRSVLVEASPYDRVWGIGMEASDPRARDPRSWCGMNLLGFALMQVRARLSVVQAQSGASVAPTDYLPRPDRQATGTVSPARP